MHKNDFLSPFLLYAICLAGHYLLFSSCQSVPEAIPSNYHHIKPDYQNIEIQPQNDTLHFALDSSSYNQIRTFNYFTHLGKPYICFFDKRVRTLNIYNFTTQQLVDRLPLKKAFAEGFSYIANFDSIFIMNDDRVMLLDSAGNIKKDIGLFAERGKKAVINIETMAFLKSNVLYTGVQPFLNESSLENQQKWAVVCGFDLQNNKKELFYHLPTPYRENLYGHSFLAYSYCINNKGNFVFSFPADTNIYETNLVDLNNAYYARSRFQTGDILPILKSTIDSNQSRKEYYMRDAYGTIYFDPYRKRYLRFAKQKIAERDYLTNKKERKRSVIILDENFKIIGESALDSTLSVFKTIFFTPDGKFYIRTNTKDEQAIHFVRLEYSDMLPTSEQLTRYRSMSKK